MANVKVKWLGGYPIEVPSQGRVGDKAVKPGDTFDMPEDEARERTDVEIVGAEKGARARKGDDA